MNTGELIWSDEGWPGPDFAAQRQARRRELAAASQRSQGDDHDQGAPRRPGRGNPRLAGTQTCRRRDQGRRPAPPRRIPRGIRAECHRPRRPRPLGARRRGSDANRHGPRKNNRPHRGHQGQVDGDPGDRPGQSARGPGITAHETDLAEMIIQLSHDRPSHIVVPALHRNRAEIRRIFRDHMPDAPKDLTDDPQDLAEAARLHLRRLFLKTRSRSAARTSRSPRPAGCSSPSPRAMAACA